MKSYLLVILSVVLMISVAGCKKKSFDPTGKSPADFIGTWKGNISTFKNNQSLKEYATVVIYPDAGTNLLSGIFFMKETSVFHEFQFVNGTLYFKVVNNDPTNPMCQNWSMGGYAVFPEEGKIDIHLSGNECGPFGTEYVNWIGTMVAAKVPADSLQYFNFAKSGNSWTYKTYLKNGDSCQVQKEISPMPANYLFSGATSQTCGWTGQMMTFQWNVTPAEFSVVKDSALCYRPFTFPINAKPGVVYRPDSSNDTITITLLDTSQVVTTPAGNFSCAYFRYTEPGNSGTEKVIRTAYLWLNVRYGVIRQMVENPVDSTDIKYQVLSSKNF